MEGIDWFDDPSNATSQRGRIRGLMPSLDEIQGGSGRALARSARLLAHEDEYFSDYVDGIWPDIVVEDAVVVDQFDRLHPAIQLRVLRRLVADGRVRAEPLESVVDGALRAPGQLDLGHGLRLVGDGVFLRVEKA